jgi:hypothetical protein
VFHSDWNALVTGIRGSAARPVRFDQSIVPAPSGQANRFYCAISALAMSSTCEWLVLRLHPSGKTYAAVRFVNLPTGSPSAREIKITLLGRPGA